eukprot:UN00155
MMCFKRVLKQSNWYWVHKRTMSKLAYDKDNLFAKIVRGDIPCYKLFETNSAIAFLDLFPVAEGHALLVTKKPYATLMDMPAKEAGELLQELPRLSKAVQAATGCDGIP